MTNNYALKLLSLSMALSTQSLTVEDRWCLECKKKATISCIFSHSPSSILLMESKPAEFFMDLHRSIEDEEVQLDFISDQWRETKEVVKNTSDTLKWGLLQLKMIDERIDGDIAQLSSLKQSIRVIPEGSTATSLAHKMECITQSRMCEQKSIESKLNSYLPATTSIAILELLLRTFGVNGDELAREQKKLLKRLEAAVSGVDDAASRPNSLRHVNVVGNNFGVAMTFFRQTAQGINIKIGSVLINLDPDIISQLDHSAFNSTSFKYQYPQLYDTEILAANDASFVLLKDVEPIISRMFVDTESLLSLKNSTDLRAASDLDVKLITEDRRYGETVGCTLAFFLNCWSQVNPRIFRSTQCSVPFGCINQGRKVIEYLSSLSQDEWKNVKVEVVRTRLLNSDLVGERN